MRARLPSPAAALAGLLVLAAALTGCGSSGSSSKGNGIEGKTPTEIVAAAKVLADSANSVHVAGSIQSGGSPITLDLHLLASKGGRGQLSENGLSFELIQIHGNVFIKGSPAFYRHVAGPTAAQLLQGRWLKAPASTGNLASLASLTDLRQLMDTTLVQHGTLSEGRHHHDRRTEGAGRHGHLEGGHPVCGHDRSAVPGSRDQGRHEQRQGPVQQLERPGLGPGAGERDRHHPVGRALAPDSIIRLPDSGVLKRPTRGADRGPGRYVGAQSERCNPSKTKDSAARPAWGGTASLCDGRSRGRKPAQRVVAQMGSQPAGLSLIGREAD